MGAVCGAQWSVWQLLTTLVGTAFQFHAIRAFCRHLLPAICNMNYETNNLDEAAYLALQGYHFTVTRTGQISALFSFETDKHFNEVRAKFWKGEATVQLHRWLATRAALKNECAGQTLSAKRVPSPSLVPAERETEAAVMTGLKYWYREGTTIKSEKYGNRPPHTSRLAEGNFYRTREDARLKRNALSRPMAHLKPWMFRARSSATTIDRLP